MMQPHDLKFEELMDSFELYNFPRPKRYCRHFRAPGLDAHFGIIEPVDDAAVSECCLAKLDFHGAWMKVLAQSMYLDWVVGIECTNCGDMTTAPVCKFCYRIETGGIL